MCHVIIELTLIGLKQPLVTSQSQARHAIQACKCRQAIPACSCPIIGQGSYTCYPSMLGAAKLCQHAITQSQAREARHTIPACSQDQSQVRKVRNTIPACTVKYVLYKRGCKSQNSRQADAAK